MWRLPSQTLTIVLKERFALSAVQTAAFFAIGRVPWLIKPVYGLLSDFVPLFGRRRKSYFVLASLLASGAGVSLALTAKPSYWQLAGLFTAMGVGLAFTDVLTDALMVEHGQPRGLTGAYQAVQWASVAGASILVGVAGGLFAAARGLRSAFLFEAWFPLAAGTMALWCVKERAAGGDRTAVAATWGALRGALRRREFWIVGGFIFFWTFSPSVGTALFYYQTDVLKFRQEFIGGLGSLGSAAGIVGAVIYAPLSRRVPLKWLVNLAIALGVGGTLGYLAYHDAGSAMVIESVFGCAGMITFLAFLDLAARACPRLVEGTFFALLMSLYNGGAQISDIMGGYLYASVGYKPLVLISAGMSALAWVVAPFVRIDRIDAEAPGEGSRALRAPGRPALQKRADDAAGPPRCVSDGAGE